MQDLERGQLCLRERRTLAPDGSLWRGALSSRSVADDFGEIRLGVAVIYETLYAKLTRLVGSLPEPDEAVRLKASGFMDQVVEGLYRGDDGFLHLSLSHYYEQNGDLVPDPDMEVRVYPDREMAEAFSFQDTYGYRAVYPAPGKVDVVAKRDLNRFLNRWLSNLLEQGHHRGGETPR